MATDTCVDTHSLLQRELSSSETAAGGGDVHALKGFKYSYYEKSTSPACFHEMQKTLNLAAAIARSRLASQTKLPSKLQIQASG